MQPNAHYIGSSLCKINSPDSSARPKIENALRIRYRAQMELASKQEQIDMMHQVHSLLLLFIVWLVSTRLVALIFSLDTAHVPGYMLPRETHGSGVHSGYLIISSLADRWSVISYLVPGRYASLVTVLTHEVGMRYL